MPISKVQSKNTQTKVAHNKKSRNQSPFPFEKIEGQISDLKGAHAPTETNEDTRIEYTFESIEEAAGRLKQAPTLKNALSFRSAVSAFLRTVVEKDLELEHHQSGHSLMKRKKYLLIVELRKNLDSIVEEVQKNYFDAFTFLERINKIKGMLVDLEK